MIDRTFRTAVACGVLSCLPALAWAGATPVTWHLFNEPGQDISIDDSGNLQDGIVKRTVMTGGIGSGRFTGGSGGRFGGALFFDTPYGDTTFAQFLADFDIAWAGTISMYVWHDYIGYRQAYIRGGAGDFGAELHSDSTIFSSMPGGDNYKSTGTKMTAGAWHHVVVTWDGAAGDANCIYLDGVLQNCTATRGTGPAFLNRAITIGQRLPQGTATTKRNLDGGVDELAFYDRALTVPEIATVRDFGVPAVPAGLMAYWNLDDPVGTLIAPSNGGNALDLYAGGGGGPQVVGPDMVASQGPTLAGNGIELDAVELDKNKPTSPALYTRVEIPDSTVMDFDKTRGSVLMWVWRSSSGFGETLLSSDDNKAQVLLRTSNSGRTIMRVNGRDVWETDSGVDLAQVGVWDHMAFTWDAITGQHVIYKNATVPAQSLISGIGGPWNPADVTDTGNWNIGYDIPERPFHGFIADFAIFDTVLSAGDVDYAMEYGVEGFVSCGNAEFEPELGEECDDGNTDETDCCTARCRVSAGTCNDGLFCTVTDVCIDGVCTGSVDPCVGNPQCNTWCDEAADVCLNPSGDPCASDGNPCTDDVCDGAGACSHPNNTLSCDDGDQCTINDTCGGGVCSGGGALDCSDGDICTLDGCQSDVGCVNPRITLSTACYWTIVAASAGAGGDAMVRAEGGPAIGGDVCTDLAVIAGTTTGSWIVTETSEEIAVRVQPGAEVAGDVVTGGGGVRGRPHETEVLNTGQLVIAPGSLVDNADGGVVDTTGADARPAVCETQQADAIVDAEYLDTLAGDADLGRIDLKHGETLTLPTPVAGGLNVIDATRVRLGDNATLRLDGGGSPETVVVLRIHGGLRTRRGVTVSLANGMSPDHVLIYARGGRCRIGINNVGSGVLLCPAGRIDVDFGTSWTGALIGGAKVDVESSVDIVHVPFLGL